jgi:hypothetical protein
MALSSRIVNLLFGRPLATSEERAEQIGPVVGIPAFGLNALSSAAYGPEAALTLLNPLGLVGVHYIVPVSAAIVGLLIIGERYAKHMYYATCGAGVCRGFS